jgi:hypothetical protein
LVELLYIYKYIGYLREREREKERERGREILIGDIVEGRLGVIFEMKAR